MLDPGVGGLLKPKKFEWESEAHSCMWSMVWILSSFLWTSRLFAGALSLDKLICYLSHLPAHRYEVCCPGLNVRDFKVVSRRLTTDRRWAWKHGDNLSFVTE